MKQVSSRNDITDAPKASPIHPPSLAGTWIRKYILLLIELNWITYTENQHMSPGLLQIEGSQSFQNEFVALKNHWKIPQKSYLPISCFENYNLEIKPLRVIVHNIILFSNWFIQIIQKSFKWFHIGFPIRMIWMIFSGKTFRFTCRFLFESQGSRQTIFIINQFFYLIAK